MARFTKQAPREEQAAPPVTPLVTEKLKAGTSAAPGVDALIAAEGGTVVSRESDGSVYAQLPGHRRGLLRFKAEAGVLQHFSERRHDWRPWERD